MTAFSSRWSRTAAALGATGLLAGCGPSLPAGGAATPSPAPGFALLGTDGARHTLADYRGQVVLVNFWATWCLPCRAEIPDLEHEWRLHRGDGVAIVGIDWREPAADASAFLAEIGATYPVLLDTDGAAYTAYGVEGLPKTFILDRQGRVLVVRSGIVRRARLDAEIRAAMAGRAPPSE